MNLCVGVDGGSRVFQSGCRIMPLSSHMDGTDETTENKSEFMLPKPVALDGSRSSLMDGFSRRPNVLLQTPRSRLRGVGGRDGTQASRRW